MTTVTEMADASERDLLFMGQALALAEQGLNSTTPNPRVGCVIVANNQVVGQGFHAVAGGAHAEVNALTDAGERARGATAYVTLEPCNHQGRTGPCTEALIAAGVAEVVYAMVDPNPQVAGKGLARLQEAGVNARGPVCEAEAKALNPGFIKRMQSGRPYVRCKLAMSLDGRTAMASGESQWITGSAAREDVQKLRARSCSIITGAGTVEADNPKLNVRSAAFGDNPRQPLRIVIDSHLRTLPDADIYTDGAATAIASLQGMLKRGTTDVWQLSHASGKVDLVTLLVKLGKMEHNEVLIEAGPTLAGAFLQAGLIDEIVIYMAGKLMGSIGKPLFELPINQMSDSLTLDINSIERIGDDWKIIAAPRAV